MASRSGSGTSSDHILGFARSLVSHRVGGRHKPHEVFQTSTIVSLVEGLYDGNVTYHDVMRHGDFGVGTFNALDGEMVALDGHFFHLRNDGADAAAAVPSVTLTDTTGSVVGFHTPDYAQGIGVAGYDLHYLSADHRSGGHVFDFTVEDPRMRVDSEAEPHLSLHTTDEFLVTRMGGDVSAEIDQAETSGGS